jgi:hypothetical protein
VLVVVVVDGGLVLLSPSISSKSLGRCHQLRTSPPHSRSKPTPWPSQNQRQLRRKRPHQKRKTKTTPEAIAQAGPTLAPGPRLRSLPPRSGRPTITLVVAAPAREGPWQTTMPPRALRKGLSRSGLLGPKARAKKLPNPDSSSSKRGTTHCSPEG